jgi:uncharacterized protein (DUF302 family)
MPKSRAPWTQAGGRLGRCVSALPLEGDIALGLGAIERMWFHFIKHAQDVLEGPMTEAGETVPFGAHPADGVVHRHSPFSVADTVARLTGAIEAAGAKLFVVVDHSGEAGRVGLTLRETKLLIFGNPAGGTPAMQASPVAALDLPLKILVWADDRGGVWMTYLSAEWLAQRHGLPADAAKPLGAVDVLTSRVAASS